MEEGRAAAAVDSRGWSHCIPCVDPGLVSMSYLPLYPHQNSVSSHEKRGAPKKRKAPQPPATTPIPVRVGGSLGQGGVLLPLETLPKVVSPGGEGTGRSGCL